MIYKYLFKGMQIENLLKVKSCNEKDVQLELSKKFSNDTYDFDYFLIYVGLNTDCSKIINLIFFIDTILLAKF